MRKTSTIVIGGIVVIVLALFAVFAQKRDMLLYRSENLGLSFSYPDSYFTEEHALSNGYTVVLMEDTEENRNLESATTTPREGPTSITVARYDNPQKQTLEEWVKNAPQSNYNLSNSTLASADITDKGPALAYTWSGLYEGESLAAMHGNDIYLFSVTYLTEQDRIRDDFRDILETVSFE